MMLAFECFGTGRIPECPLDPIEGVDSIPPSKCSPGVQVPWKLEAFAEWRLRSITTNETVKSPDNVSYPNAMRKPLLLMVLFSPVMVSAEQRSPPTPDVNPVTLHEQLSPSCELIQ